MVLFRLQRSLQSHLSAIRLLETQTNITSCITYKFNVGKEWKIALNRVFLQVYHCL